MFGRDISPGRLLFIECPEENNRDILQKHSRKKPVNDFSSALAHKTKNASSSVYPGIYAVLTDGNGPAITVVQDIPFKLLRKKGGICTSPLK